MQSVVYIDGDADRLDPADRGLAYGDGLFETMLAIDGHIRWLDYHFDRLEHGCRRLSLPAPSRQSTRTEIMRRIPGRGDAVVKLVLTRGNGPRGYAPPPSPRPTMLISATARERTAPTGPVAATVLTLRLAESELLAGIKHLCRLEQVLAQIELRERHAEEGILLSRSGKIVGCTSSNLFLIRNGGLVTPRIETAGIAGVMRRVVIAACKASAIAVEEADLGPEALHAADGLFQTNAIIGIREIGSLDERRYSASGDIDRVRDAVRAFTDA